MEQYQFFKFPLRHGDFTLEMPTRFDSGEVAFIERLLEYVWYSVKTCVVPRPLPLVLPRTAGEWRLR